MLVARRGQPGVPSDAAVEPLAPADDGLDARLPCRCESSPGRLGPDEQQRGPRVLEDVRRLASRQVEVDRHRGSAAEQPAEVGQGGLRRVLGEYRHPVRRPEIGRDQVVGDLVERAVDLGPPEPTVAVDEGGLVGPVDGQLFSEPGQSATTRWPG